jgi:hypothetical protein
MVRVDSAILGQAVGFGEEYLGGNIADGRCDGSDRNLPKIFQYGIARQDKNRPFLVRR